MSFLSDSSDEDKVEDVLNQAMDQSILDQIAKINCSSFSTDSVLPTHLETRFSRLKSFPQTFNPHLGDKIVKNTGFEQNPVEKSDFFCSNSSESMRRSKKPEKGMVLNKKSGTWSNYSSSNTGFEQNPVEKSDFFCSNSSESMRRSKKPEKGMVLNKKSGAWSNYSSSISSNSSAGSAIGSPIGPNSEKKKVVRSKSRSNSYNSYDLSQSPKKSGCFFCSPKWGSEKNRKKERGIGNAEDLVSEFAKKQNKLLEKMLREEDKISREAEKIVNLVKQGSARMNISDIR